MIIENIKSLAIVFLGSALFLSCNRLNALKTEIMQAEKQALEQSLALQNQISDIEDKYKNEKENSERALAELRSRIASGVQLKNRNLSGNSSSQSRENDCRLSPETASALVDIAAKGDEAVRRLNQCIDQYNELRNLKK